jgi:hypothetical protein
MHRIENESVSFRQEFFMSARRQQVIPAPLGAEYTCRQKAVAAATGASVISQQFHSHPHTICLFVVDTPLLTLTPLPSLARISRRSSSAITRVRAADTRSLFLCRLSDPIHSIRINYVQASGSTFSSTLCTSSGRTFLSSVDLPS